MKASDRDRAYFQRIGAIKEALHQEAADAHARASIDQRIARSWALYLAHRGEVALSERDDNPSPFYDRARRLGLYLE